MREGTEPDYAILSALETVTTEVLTLIEGLDEPAFRDARLTRLAVRARLLSASVAARQASEAMRSAMPELDWQAWNLSGARIAQDGPSEHEATWFAASTLAPLTLGWLRLYRNQRPELFQSRA